MTGASEPARARRALRLAATRGPALRRLPRRVALFQARAHALAFRLGDEFALSSAARPEQLAALLDLARDRRHVVELGTATGWTASSFALAHAGARITTADPVVQPHRERYLDLLDNSARERMTLLQVTGVAAADEIVGPVDLLFIDSSHERDQTVAEWHAWRPQLSADAVIAFHDHLNPAFPGVAAAVEELGLSGRHTLGMFVVGHA